MSLEVALVAMTGALHGDLGVEIRELRRLRKAFDRHVKRFDDRLCLSNDTSRAQSSPA